MINISSAGITINDTTGRRVFDSGKRMPHLVGYSEGTVNFTSPSIGVGVEATYFDGSSTTILEYALGSMQYDYSLETHPSWTFPASQSGGIAMGMVRFTNGYLGTNPALQGRWIPINGTVITRQWLSRSNGYNYNGALPGVSANVPLYWVDGIGILEQIKVNYAPQSGGLTVSRTLCLGGALNDQDMCGLLNAPQINGSWNYGAAAAVPISPGAGYTGAVITMPTSTLGISVDYRIYLALP